MSFSIHIYYDYFNFSRAKAKVAGLDLFDDEEEEEEADPFTKTKTSSAGGSADSEVSYNHCHSPPSPVLSPFILEIRPLVLFGYYFMFSIKKTSTINFWLKLNKVNDALAVYKMNSDLTELDCIPVCFSSCLYGFLETCLHRDVSITVIYI